MPGPAFLDGDHVTLRAVTDDDYEFLAEHRNRPSVRRSIGQDDPMTASDIGEMIESSEDSAAFLPCIDGSPIGYTWAFSINEGDSHAKIGYWIIESERGEGYATETVDLLAEWAFVDHGLHRLEAHVFEHNRASARVLEKVGFEQEGTFRECYHIEGEYVDADVYGLLAREWR